MKGSLILLVFLGGFMLGPGLRAAQDDEKSVGERRVEAYFKRIEQFETMKGRVYQDVRITAIDDGGVSFSHASGTARLRFDDLSPQQQRYFGLDAEAAAEAYRKEELAREAYEKSVEARKAAHREALEKAEEERRIAEEKREAERALAVEKKELDPSEAIPTVPTLKRIDSEWYRPRYRYSPYRGYGYGYGGYYGGNYFRPGYGIRYHPMHYRRSYGWGARIGGGSIIVGW